MQILSNNSSIPKVTMKVRWITMKLLKVFIKWEFCHTYLAAFVVSNAGFAHSRHTWKLDQTR